MLLLIMLFKVDQVMLYHLIIIADKPADKNAASRLKIYCLDRSGKKVKEQLQKNGKSGKINVLQFIVDMNFLNEIVRNMLSTCYILSDTSFKSGVVQRG